MYAKVSSILKINFFFLTLYSVSSFQKRCWELLHKANAVEEIFLLNPGNFKKYNPM